MNTTIVAAALLLGLSTASAFAEGNGEPYANYHRVAVPAQLASDTGSQAYTALRRAVVVPGNAEALPQNGSQSIVQTANSLPVGFEEGTTAYAQAQSVREWVSAHQASPDRLASR